MTKFWIHFNSFQEILKSMRNLKLNLNSVNFQNFDVSPYEIESTFLKTFKNLPNLGPTLFHR